MFWPRNGSLLPFSGETHAWFQARRGNSGSKLPVWGSIRLLKAATSRRTPNVPSAPCVKNYGAWSVPLALHLPDQLDAELDAARTLGRQDLAERRRAEEAVRQIKIRMIESIEEFGAELQVEIITDL